MHATVGAHHNFFWVDCTVNVQYELHSPSLSISFYEDKNAQEKGMYVLFQRTRGLSMLL